MENNDFLTKQIITYIGNKRAFLQDIGAEVEAIRKALNKDSLVCLDMFSGSGIVARLLKQYSSLVIANDLEDYSAVLNECYLSNVSEFNTDEFTQWLNYVKQQTAQHPVEGLITTNYAAANEDNITADDRLFYTRENAILIDSYRHYIDSVPKHLQKYFLAQLIVEASIHVNTSGVFKGFYKDKQTGVGQFGGTGRNALSRIMGSIDISLPVLSNCTTDYRVYKMDAEKLAEELPEVDVAYLDPPYNQHPYGSNYFMLNVIANNRIDGNMSRVSGIPDGWNRSKFNTPKTARASLEKIVSALKAKYIILSYNNEGFISYDEILQTLSKYGSVNVKQIQYNTFRGSRNLAARNIYTNEYIFTLQKDLTKGAITMSQHDSLRNRTEQHKPKNEKSKQDDKQIYIAMNNVRQYLMQRFDFDSRFSNYEIQFEKNLQIQYMVDMIRKKRVRQEFDMRFLDRTIVPDGGVLFLVNKQNGEKLPLVIAEIKRQGTNNERQAEGKSKQATGNAIERLGKNLTGIKAMLNYEKITPFVCFGWGCDFADSEECGTVLSKVVMMNEFYPINRIYVFKKDGNADLNYFSPVSMYFREERWTVDEMTDIMKEIAETSFRYWVF